MTNFQGSTDLDIVLITDFTNGPQNQFLSDLATEYLPNLNVGTTLCSYACSDHASWTNKNYPASFPFEATFNGSNRLIDTSNDKIEASGNNANHALKFAKLGLSYVGELAKGSIVTTNQIVLERISTATENRMFPFLDQIQVFGT